MEQLCALWGLSVEDEAFGSCLGTKVSLESVAVALVWSTPCAALTSTGVQLEILFQMPVAAVYEEGVGSITVPRGREGVVRGAKEGPGWDQKHSLLSVFLSWGGNVLRSRLDEGEEGAEVLPGKCFCLEVLKLWGSNILGGSEQQEKSLEKRLSLLLRGGGSSAGEERAQTGERVAKKLSAFSPLCHLPCWCFPALAHLSLLSSSNSFNLFNDKSQSC